MCSVEQYDPSQLDKPTLAQYGQKLNLTVFGKKVFGYIKMQSYQGSLFSDKILSAYSKITKNLDNEVANVVKMASVRLAKIEGSEASTLESTMKRDIDYVSISIQDSAIKGKPDAIWFEVAFAFKGNEHIFSLENTDGKYEETVSMNG